MKTCHGRNVWNRRKNKIAKFIGLIYKTKPYLDKDSLSALYFSCIHSYINYANLVWGSTNRTYLRKMNSQQKQALSLIHNKDRLYHSKELFESWEILKIYKLKLFNAAVLTHKIKKKKLPHHNSWKNLSNLLIPIYPVFQVGNHKVNYANVDFEFPLEVQQYGTN